MARLIEPSLTWPQYDALVSFTFNVGEGNLARSTLRRLLNSADSRLDCMRAAAEFDRWVYANNQRLRGLERRRADERAMFESGCQHWPEEPQEAVSTRPRGYRRELWYS